MNLIKPILGASLMLLLSPAVAMDQVTKENGHGLRMAPTYQQENPVAGWCEILPHRGWKFNKIQDLYGRREKCTMCHKPNVRYLHWMLYPSETSLKYLVTVDVDCAGRMEGNIEAAKARQARIEQRAAERAAWPARHTWKTKGKETTLTDRCGKDGQMHTIIIKQSTKFEEQGFYLYKIDKEKQVPVLKDTLEEAKIRAFEIFWLEETQ